MIFLHRHSGIPCDSLEIRSGVLDRPEIREIFSLPRDIALWIDGSQENPVIRETAAALIGFCRDLGSEGRLILLDPSGGISEPRIFDRGARRVNPFACPHFEISSNVRFSTLRISSFWLRNLTLVVLCGPVSHRQIGLSSILLAQAKLLVPPGAVEKLYLPEYIYKAHELLRCDLGIVCGNLSAGKASSGPFWAVSNNDLTLEEEIARCCGVAYERLPHIQFCGRHLFVQENVSEAGGPPLTLEGFGDAFPKLRYRVAYGAARILAGGSQTLRTSAANLRKAPRFLAKTLGRT